MLAALPISLTKNAAKAVISSMVFIAFAYPPSLAIFVMSGGS